MNDEFQNRLARIEAKNRDNGTLPPASQGAGQSGRGNGGNGSGRPPRLDPPQSSGSPWMRRAILGITLFVIAPALIGLGVMAYMMYGKGIPGGQFSAVPDHVLDKVMGTSSLAGEIDESKALIGLATGTLSKEEGQAAYKRTLERHGIDPETIGADF